MRALVVCVCMLAASVCEALDVETRALGKCGAGERLAQERALENATLHDAIYKWAHEKDVGTWDWAPGAHASMEILDLFSVTGVEAAALVCVRVNYTASIELPSVFAGLLSVIGIPQPIPLQVDKIVCHGEDILLEDAKIEAPVVGHVKMQARHNFYNNVDVVSSAHTILVLPWYAGMLSSQVSAALSKSLKEKFQAVVRSMCVSDGALLQRKLTPTNSSGFAVAPALPGTRVRRFPLVRTDKNVETLKLGRVGLRRMARPTSASEVWV
jgi:hypothetical protein